MSQVSGATSSLNLYTCVICSESVDSGDNYAADRFLLPFVRAKLLKTFLFYRNLDLSWVADELTRAESPFCNSCESKLKKGWELMLEAENIFHGLENTALNCYGLGKEYVPKPGNQNFANLRDMIAGGALVRKVVPTSASSDPHRLFHWWNTNEEADSNATLSNEETINPPASEVNDNDDDSDPEMLRIDLEPVVSSGQGLSIQKISAEQPRCGESCEKVAHSKSTAKPQRPSPSSAQGKTETPATSEVLFNKYDIMPDLETLLCLNDEMEFPPSRCVRCPVCQIFFSGGDSLGNHRCPAKLLINVPQPCASISSPSSGILQHKPKAKRPKKPTKRVELNFSCKFCGKAFARIRYCEKHEALCTHLLNEKANQDAAVEMPK